MPKIKLNIPEREILYKKHGRRYEPLGYEFTGFPSDGVWLVQNESLGVRQSLIMRVGDLIDPKPLIGLEGHREEVEAAVRKELATKRYSVSSLVDAVFKALAEKGQAEPKQQVRW